MKACDYCQKEDKTTIVSVDGEDVNMCQECILRVRPDDLDGDHL